MSKNGRGSNFTFWGLSFGAKMEKSKKKLHVQSRETKKVPWKGNLSLLASYYRLKHSEKEKK